MTVRTKALRFVYLVLLTLAAFIITVNGLDHLSFVMIAFGMVLFLFTLLLFLSRRPLQSLALTGALIIVLQLVNQLKVHYYKERLFFSDFYVATDVHNFETLLYYPEALACLVGLSLFIGFTGYLFRKTLRVGCVLRIGALIITVLLGGGLYLMAKMPVPQKKWQAGLPKGKGILINLYYSAQQLSYTAPVYSASDRYFLKKAAMLMLPTLSKPNVQPDIVVFLQESTFNPLNYRFDNRHLPHYAMFTQPYGGLMRVQTFGGKTWLTEFALLTGLSSDDFGINKNAVFYLVIPHIKSSLFRELAQNGYETMVLSPMGFANYNAGPSYRSLGVHRFYQPQDLGYDAPKNSNLWHISSETMLNYVKKVLNQKHDKPRFIFVLSMAEHGPYDTETPDTYAISSKTHNPEFSGALNDYLGRMDKLNQATLHFIAYLKQRRIPTLFVYFGDHQAALEWRGGYRYPYCNPDYITQFSFVSNYPITMNQYPLMDISLLGGLLLEKAGVMVSPFYQANIQMRYLCDGKLDDCEDKELLNSYKSYIYHTLSIASRKGVN